MVFVFVFVIVNTTLCIKNVKLFVLSGKKRIFAFAHL